MTETRAGEDTVRTERIVLAGMLRGAERIADVVPVLEAADFYADAHQRIYSGVVDLWQNGKPADLVALADWLKGKGWIADVGGYAYLQTVYEADPTGANVVYYAGLVKDRSTDRRLQAAAQEILSESARPTASVGDRLATAERLILQIGEARCTDTLTPASQVVEEVYDRMDGYCTGKGSVQGITTGLCDLDAKLGGLPPGSLTLLAARAGQGKTTLALNVASHVVLHLSKAVLVASLEMTRTELMERLMCSLASVDSHRLRRGMVTDDEVRRLTAQGERIKGAKLWIDDTCHQTVLRIAAMARRLKRRGGLDLVIVDYVQLVQPEDSRAARWEAVGAISRRLKVLAKDAGVPVIACAQLNRSLEDRADATPRLSDLRESGNLEQDADTVILLHRPKDQTGVVDAIVAKQRNGPTGTVSLSYEPRFTRFGNLARCSDKVGAHS